MFDSRSEESDSAVADAAPSARARLVYVSVGGEARLAVVELGIDGSLSARSDMDVSLPGNPGPLAYGRSSSRLYVGLKTGAIATIAVDGEGRPSLLGTTLDTGSPVYLSVARNEAVLVAAYFGADELRSFNISGTPPHSQTDQLTAGDEPHAALIGPGGTLYVPHRTGNMTRWYDISVNGEFTMAGELPAEASVGPRHIDFTPSGQHAYVVNEFGDSLSAHTVGADGSLTRFQTLPTLPNEFDGDSNTCADVHVLPGGRFVYASNRGHDSIAMFSIATDGSLTSIGTVPTEETPREFDVSPDGRFVVVAGQGSGFLQSYSVGNDGSLTPLARLEVGPTLNWAVID